MKETTVMYVLHHLQLLVCCLMSPFVPPLSFLVKRRPESCRCGACHVTFMCVFWTKGSHRHPLTTKWMGAQLSVPPSHRATVPSWRGGLPREEIKPGAPAKIWLIFAGFSCHPCCGHQHCWVQEGVREGAGGTGSRFGVCVVMVARCFTRTNSLVKMNSRFGWVPH